MPKPIRALYRTLTLGLMIALVSLSAQGDPLLNGMAVHQELGRDRFIGAIYSENLTDNADELLAANVPMRMELKVTADRGIAARRFGRMWIEGMAINNRQNALSEQADNMAKFTNLFKERLRENDHVVLTLNPGEGVAVSVNDIDVGRIEDDGFFPLLLSAWLGPVPLSSTFREQLLAEGDVSTSLTSRYRALQPTEERIQQVAQWNAPEPAPEPEPEPQQQVAQTEPEPEPEAEPAPSRPQIELPSPTMATAGGTAQSEPEPEPAPEPAPASSSSVSSAPEPQVASVSSQPEPEPEEEAAPAFTAESLRASQRYFSNMLLKVRRNLEYPRRAARRGYEGELRIRVVVDRDGNLLSSELLESSEHSSLDDEAMDVVEDVAPYDPVPDVVTGSTQEYTLPITFKLAPE